MLTLTPEMRMYLLIALTALAICPIAYWRLFCRLSAVARLLAAVMLLAQLLIIAAGLWHRPLYELGWSAWHLDYELNIPTALATTQLALVAVTALVCASLSSARSYRVYLLGIGILFSFLAWDEFFPIRNHTWNWPPFYAAMGAIVAGFTASMAARAPATLRIWHICTLAGLALSGAGALGVEQLRYEGICTQLGFWKEGRCMMFALEETLEFLGIWLVLVSFLGQLTQIMPALSLSIKRLLFVMPGIAFPLLVLFCAKS